MRWIVCQEFPIVGSIEVASKAAADRVTEIINADSVASIESVCLSPYDDLRRGWLVAIEYQTEQEPCAPSTG